MKSRITKPAKPQKFKKPEPPELALRKPILERAIADTTAWCMTDHLPRPNLQGVLPQSILTLVITSPLRNRNDPYPLEHKRFVLEALHLLNQNPTATLPNAFARWVLWAINHSAELFTETKHYMTIAMPEVNSLERFFQQSINGKEPTAYEWSELKSSILARTNMDILWVRDFIRDVIQAHCHFKGIPHVSLRPYSTTTIPQDPTRTIVDLSISIANLQRVLDGTIYGNQHRKAVLDIIRQELTQERS
jgi:hypothetical protein